MHLRNLLCQTLLFLSFIVVISLTATAQDNRHNRDPEKAQLVTSDIDLFWQAYDLAGKEPDPQKQAEIYQREYLDKGSIGLQDIVKVRGFKAADIVRMLRAKPTYFANLRKITPQLAQVREQVIAASRRLKELYDDARFPDVFFCISAFTGGGTISSRGLLIGVELFGRTENLPLAELNEWQHENVMTISDLAPLIAHELIHFQQKNQIGFTLLRRSVKEGAADFIGELIAGGTLRRTLMTRHWADAREPELQAQFQKEMNLSKAKEYEHWFYAAKDRPYDLGYYMGYKICQSYYGYATDKRQAIREILEIRDIDAFLKASRYTEKFAPPVIQRNSSP